MSDMSGTPRQGAHQTCLTANNGPQQTAPTIKSTPPLRNFIIASLLHICRVIQYGDGGGPRQARAVLRASVWRCGRHPPPPRPGAARRGTMQWREGGTNGVWLHHTQPARPTRAGEPRGDVPAACRAWLAPAALQQGQRQRRGCAARAHPRGMERWWRERGRRANPGGAARRRRGALPGPQAGHAGRVGGRRSRGAYAPHR